MKRFEITVEIQAAAQKAWAVLLDVERWPEWMRVHYAWTSRGPGLQVAGLLSALVARPLRGLNQKYLGFEAEGLRKRCEA